MISLNEWVNILYAKLLTPSGIPWQKNRHNSQMISGVVTKKTSHEWINSALYNYNAKTKLVYLRNRTVLIKFRVQFRLKIDFATFLADKSVFFLP